jgi:transcriptional regulator with XRE-family HTH domain
LKKKAIRCIIILAINEKRCVMLERRLKAARYLAGINQGEIAELLDVSYRTVGNWETGVTEPKASEIRKFAAECGVQISFLMPDKENSI